LGPLFEIEERNKRVEEDRETFSKGCKGKNVGLAKILGKKVFEGGKFYLDCANRFWKNYYPNNFVPFFSKIFEKEMLNNFAN
jgi:hypothetical protein